MFSWYVLCVRVADKCAIVVCECQVRHGCTHDDCARGFLMGSMGAKGW